VVYFSGFNDTIKSYTLEYKNQLAQMVTELGGEVRFDNDFNEHITHVVSHFIPHQRPLPVNERVMMNCSLGS